MKEPKWCAFLSSPAYSDISQYFQNYLNHSECRYICQSFGRKLLPNFNG